MAQSFSCVNLERGANLEPKLRSSRRMSICAAPVVANGCRVGGGAHFLVAHIVTRSITRPATRARCPCRTRPERAVFRRAGGALVADLAGRMGSIRRSRTTARPIALSDPSFRGNRRFLRDRLRSSHSDRRRKSHRVDAVGRLRRSLCLLHDCLDCHPSQAGPGSGFLDPSVRHLNRCTSKHVQSRCRATAHITRAP